MASRTKVSSSLAGTVNSGAVLDQMRRSGQNTALFDYVQTGLRRKSQRRRKLVQSATAALGVIALLFWAVPYFKDTATIGTLPAHRQQFTLADGSQAELNARTELQTDFRYGRRLVHLDKGEAYFSVVKDPAHPFLVETPLGTVRVTGTKFNVRLDSDGKAAVTLFEGSVNVALAHAAPSAHLTPGQEADFRDGPAQVRTLSAAELSAVVAWREGRIVLDGLTVAEAAARLADYHGCTITVSPSVAQIRLGGSTPLDQLGEFFEMLKAIGGLQVIDRMDGSYQISGR